MATYAIGDIQGCYRELLCLLEQIEFDPEKDKLWLTGDLVNRGPESLSTLTFLYNIRDSVVSVLGNHDLHLLAVAWGHVYQRGKDTFDDILDAPNCDTLLQWLREMPLVHHDPKLNCTLVHAGIPPMWSVQDALKKSREVEEVLQGKKFEKYLRNMYGDLPNKWSGDLSGKERWRLITNYFTRMRFCDADGRLELNCKLGPGSAPAGFSPWFKHKKRKTKDDSILFGHWASLEGKTGSDNLIALDTGCVWGRELSAYRIEDGKWFSCSCNKQ